MNARLDQYRTILTGHGIEPGTIRAKTDGTLVDLGSTLPASALPTASASLATEMLEPGVVLGRGGMGEVRLATQRSLRREVAVKTVLDHGNACAQAALLKEAWAGGALEHPSVVPIHTLTRLDGAAAVVMKRIAGASWGDVLEHPEKHPRFTGAGALEAHLRVFVQVCHAIAFAHERGILHLDLKPDNVMIGDLGEVYVLDWGLAAATHDGPEWLPRGKDLTLPAGTPGYMAPELAGAIHDQIDTSTDVYLLGAVLHHVVTGDYPHRGDNVLVVLMRAYFDEPPTYGPEVPRGLAEILTRALQRERGDRFPSVDALREAVEAFLRHRGAEHFMTRAHETLAQIDAGLAAGKKGDVELEALLAQCEVALAEVRREWPAHPRLGETEDALVVRRARHAILDEHLESARSLVAALRERPADLVLALAELERKKDARDRYERGLEQMAHEVDLTLGSTDRRRLFARLGVLWTFFSFVLGYLYRARVAEIGYRELLIECAVIVVTMVPYAWIRRARYFHNRANRRLYGGLTFIAINAEIFFAACGLNGVPVEDALAITPIFYAFGFATLAMALDRRIFVGAIPLLATALACALAPIFSFELIGLGGGLAVAAILAAWEPKPPVTGSA